MFFGILFGIAVAFWAAGAYFDIEELCVTGVLLFIGTLFLGIIWI